MRRLTGTDLVVVALMVAVPTLALLVLVWFPALGTVALSFTDWNGIGPLSGIDGVSMDNYVNVATNYPPFWPALQHNLIWLMALFLVATPIGMALAVLLDRQIRFSRFYQTAFYLPVVLSLALIGFVWQLIYSRDQGLLNAVLGTQVDWYGDPDHNLWAAIVATCWRHIGYIMLLYLAGLKAVDPSLREAAAIDGASEWQAFLPDRLPGAAPDQHPGPGDHRDRVAARVRPGLGDRQGRNGLELIATLVTSNVVGEPAGSASARPCPRSCC